LAPIVAFDVADIDIVVMPTALNMLGLNEAEAETVTVLLAES
jgi:hypothetical protein